VDNNSTDDTRAVIATFVAKGRVRYASEPLQGLSHARQRGVAVERGDILAFTDDDVRVGPTWIQAIARAFAEHPDVDMVGGRVEPEWEVQGPASLARGGGRAAGVAARGRLCAPRARRLRRSAVPGPARGSGVPDRRERRGPAP